jgi:hypothetical protein
MKHLRPAILITAWLAVVLGGMGFIARYKSLPGEAAQAPAQWPEGTALSHRAGTFTLVLFAHPHCPCTTATLAELERLMAKLGEKLEVEIVFIHLEGDEDFEHARLVERARALKDATVIIDEGVETKRFGTFTSGQTLLYGPDGRLKFHGGITPSRGHEGDNAGEQRILALVRGEDTQEGGTSMVYGCALNDPKPQGGR